MTLEEREKQKLIAKFNESYSKNQRGVFRKKTRERIMGIQKKTGRGRKESDFWYDVRNDIKGALTDIELFLEFANQDQISQVMTSENLASLIEKLASSKYPIEKDVRIADIANLFIQTGFRYLYYTNINDITLSHKRTINESLDLANYLLWSFMPAKQRQYYQGTSGL